MAITRVTVLWTGLAGLPGYTNFFFGGAATPAALTGIREDIRAAFSTLTTYLPNGLETSTIGEHAILDEDTGALIEYVSSDASVLNVVGSGTGAYSGPSGAVVNWNTNTVNRGRRVRGRTFIVPLVNTAYDSSGTLSGPALTALNNFANLLVGEGAANQFGVWSRPVGGTGGVFGPATSHSVPDMAAVLRSRRD